MPVMNVLVEDPRFRPGAKAFHTPALKKRFSILEVSGEGIRIQTQSGSRIRIPSECINAVPSFLSGCGEVLIGSSHGVPLNGSLDFLVQKYTGGQSAAPYVAAILEEARILEIDRRRPNKVRLLDSYGRLVRDKVPAMLIEGGQTPYTHNAEKEEYWLSIIKRIKEEAQELSKRYDPERLADLLELVYAMAEYKKNTKEELERLRKKKEKEQGGYGKRIILDGIGL